MKTDMEDIAGLVHDLSIAEAAPQDHNQERDRSTCSHPASLQEAIQVLVQSTKTITSQAQTVKSQANDANTSSSLPIADVCSLHEALKKLTNTIFDLQTTTHAITEATERSVIIRLRSLGSQSATIGFERPAIEKLLSHFDGKIREIVREVLNNTGDRDVLWKVAEECYKQVTNHSGILHADDYFVPLEEASLGWPYDLDFESEEYYEHENCLEVDEDYAAAFQVKAERRSEAREKDRQMNSQIWIAFWIRVLNNSPAGPTLFYPPASFNTQFLDFDAAPQYLFRTFDEASSGRNDETVIASAASISGLHESSRTDLLTLERRKAAELLHMHLTKPCFDGERSDNLMSWTSSLLFAIQYAVWRLRMRRCRSADIKICAVNTRNFPQGQFARDIWLLKAYYATAKELGDPVRDFFDFRLEKEDFYNGEYLSQGVVNHGNRSCVVSLEHLIEAGLFQLYPEFEDAKGSEKWTKRVRELRHKWSAEQGTTDQEIQLALEVGRNCFTQFEPSDIASILLTFKNRKCSGLTPISNLAHLNKQQPEWANKPKEVHRYWIATEAVKSYNQLPNVRISHLSRQGHKTLREIFDL